MKKLCWKTGGLGCAVLLAVCFVLPGTAQEANKNRPTIGPIFQATDEVSETAMLTEQGRQLAVLLRRLRHSESTMGRNHPSLPAVQAQIAAVKEQLAVLESGGQTEVGANDQFLPDAMLSMSDEELRRLVFRMAMKIEQLESRLQQVEKLIEVH